MRGSEAQVKWARNISKEAVAYFNEVLANVVEKGIKVDVFTDEIIEGVNYDDARTSLNAVIEALENELIDASIIIDNKDDMGMLSHNILKELGLKSNAMKAIKAYRMLQDL